MWIIPDFIFFFTNLTHNELPNLGQVTIAFVELLCVHDFIGGNDTLFRDQL